MKYIIGIGSGYYIKETNLFYSSKSDIELFSIDKADAGKFDTEGDVQSFIAAFCENYTRFKGYNFEIVEIT